MMIGRLLIGIRARRLLSSDPFAESSWECSKSARACSVDLVRDHIVSVYLPAVLPPRARLYSPSLNLTPLPFLVMLYFIDSSSSFGMTSVYIL